MMQNPAAQTSIHTSVEALEDSALDEHRRGLMRCTGPGPETGCPVELAPLPEAVTREPPSQKGPARWAYERIGLYLQNFEQQLDADHEIALGFAGSAAGVLRIEGVGYFDPDLITFYGRTPEGHRTQLIQHVSQLNLMLQAVPKDGPEDAPPRRFGFQTDAPRVPDLAAPPCGGGCSGTRR